MKSDGPEPILKYPGGKRAVIDQLAAHFPKQRHALPGYGELFAGGLAPFFLLFAGVVRGPVFLNDNNTDLINLYTVLQQQPEALLRALRTHTEAFAAVASDREKYDELYLRLRDGDLALPSDPVSRAARKVVLNKTCYNGMERYNKSGRFNVPPGWKAPRSDGSIAAPSIYNEDNIRAASHALAQATLSCGDFEPVIEQIPTGYFVYFDPPYIGTFANYSQTAFTWHDQERLAAAIRKASDRGVLFAYSNSDTPESRSLMDGFTIHTITAPRSVSCKGGSRGEVTEILAVNY